MLDRFDNLRSALNERYEDRIRAAFPLDFPAKRPFYLLNQYEAGEGFGGALRAASAYTSAALSVQLEPRLRALGFWKGAGPIVVLDALRQYPSDDAIFAVVLHELAHVLDLERLYCLACDPAQRENVLKTPLPDEDVTLFDPHVPLFSLHEVWFIRAALHLKHRAELAGEAPTFAAMHLAGPFYGLSDAGAYHALLREEIHDRANESISSILTSPVPMTAAGLFYDDVLVYYRRRCQEIVRRTQAEGLSEWEARQRITAELRVDAAGRRPEALGSRQR